MDQAVFQTLTDTLSADPNARMAAELRLKELQQNPGTEMSTEKRKKPMHGTTDRLWMGLNVVILLSCLFSCMLRPTAMV